MKLTDDWKSLWRAYSVQILAIGAVLPEALQLIADNTDSLTWMNDGYKSGIRLTCMILALLLRPIHQNSVSGPK